MGSKILRQGDRYKAKLEKTLADGKVTKQEATAILRDAKDGHFAEVEAHYLSSFVSINAKKFDPAAHQKLLDFVKTEMVAFAQIAGEDGLPTPRRQPAMTPDSQKNGARYEARSGHLVVNGMDLDDAVQGQVGDCYFIASLASLAKVKPELLAKAITTNPDGTFTVTFFEREKGQKTPTPVKVTVDATFPVRYGGPEYASARSSQELWPLVFEKAFAAWKGGFDAIEGGMAATALESLTGVKPEFFPVGDGVDANQVFKRLQAACGSGAAVVALSKTWDPSERGVVSDHAYSLLGVEERGGQRFVQLRNPWGQREPGHDGRDDGIFTMPLATFLTSFATVEFAKLP